MRTVQRRFIMAGLLLIALVALFPPTVREYNGRQHVERAFLFQDFEGMICIAKLAAEWVLITAMTSFLIICSQGLAKGLFADSTDSSS